MMPSTKPHYEPHATGTVKPDGQIYVGRKHAGKRAEVWFLREDDDDVYIKTHTPNDTIFTNIMSIFVNAPIPVAYQKHPGNMSDELLISFQDWCSNNCVIDGQDSASQTIDAALEIYNSLMRLV